MIRSAMWTIPNMFGYQFPHKRPVQGRKVVSECLQGFVAADSFTPLCQSLKSHAANPESSLARRDNVKRNAENFAGCHFLWGAFINCFYLTLKKDSASLQRCSEHGEFSCFHRTTAFTICVSASCSIAESIHDAPGAT